MARPICAPNASSAAPSMARKPSTWATSAGVGCWVCSVSGLSKLASRLSTGLMTWRFTAAASSAVSVPYRAYIFAVRTAGRSPWLSS